MKLGLLESGVRPSLLRYEGRKFWRTQARSAFTLIELLVVIAIIAVLAAMLLPSLSQAKNRAQMVIDLNNVHSILLATHMYCHDNKDCMPRIGWGDIGVEPIWCFGVPCPEPPDNSGNVKTYNSYYPQQVASFRITTPKANACQLYTYLKNPKLLRCPADIPNAAMYHRQQYLTSYVWNGAVICCAAGAKLGQFRSSDILLWEGPDVYTNQSCFYNDTSSWPTEGFSSRHGRGATIGRASGAAERMSSAEFGRETDASGRNDVWCCPCSIDGHW